MDFTKPKRACSPYSPRRKLGAAAKATAKEITKVALRDTIKGEGLINDVVEIALVLQRGTEPVRTQDGTWVDLSVDRARIASLTASAGLKLKLLNKVLPDLANIQLSGDQDKPLNVYLTAAESKL